MQEYFEKKHEQEIREHNDKFPPVQPANGVTEYITISVAEYHFLTKAATMLEVIMNAQTYDHTAVVNAVKANIENMQRIAEAGADQ